MHASECLLVLGLENVEAVHGMSWIANVLPLENFGFILSNKIATIGDRFKSLVCSKSLNIEASFIKFEQNVYGWESLPQSNFDLILTKMATVSHL